METVEMIGGRLSPSLELSREEMRSLGYLAVDLLVEHFDGLGSMPAGSKTDRPTLEARLREPLPERGSDARELLSTLQERVFSSMMRVSHPRFFAFVPSPGNFAGAIADLLVSGINPFLGTWFAGSGPAELELVTVDWLRQICELPEGAGGLFVSGGSMANLTALAAARHHRLGDRFEDATVYFSDQTHSSVERALRVLGFRPDQLRKIASDPAFRLPMESLQTAVAADRAAGRRPFCVVANAGTTNTGAVDSLPQLVAWCREQGLWLHADGAYGAAAMLTCRGRELLRGLGEVDSLSLDPHKWLFQPFEIGCVLLRDERLLRDTFRIMPEYLRDAHRFQEEVNLCDRGVQLTRNFRALKLWLTLKLFGIESFRAAVERGFELAETAERMLRERPSFQVISPAQMAMISFRYFDPRLAAAQLDSINQRLVGEMVTDGYAVVSSTLLRGCTALRFCTINPRTTAEEIEETIVRLERFGARLAAGL